VEVRRSSIFLHKLSVVDAVECATVLQRELARRNEGVASDRRSRGAHTQSVDLLTWVVTKDKTFFLNGLMVYSGWTSLSL